MIQDGTVVNITDNAGGKVGKVFKVLGSSRHRYAGIGDKVIISIKIFKIVDQVSFFIRSN